MLVVAVEPLPESKPLLVVAPVLYSSCPFIMSSLLFLGVVAGGDSAIAEVEAPMPELQSLARFS